MRYQYSLRDLMLFAAAVAVVMATIVSGFAVIAFVGIGLALPWVWRRPIVFRCWLILTSSLGGGMGWFGYLGERGQYISEYGMTTDELSAWGLGMLLGAAAAYWLFLRMPPQ